MQEIQNFDIKAIIGLGNPGHKFELNRHNIGFLILDAFGDKFGAQWDEKSNMLIAEIEVDQKIKGDSQVSQIGGSFKKIILIKPQTFMNSSGKVIPFLQKKGIKPENILVIHDELEMPFGKIKIKKGGSARGHNGLKSIIEHCGPDFVRLCFGIGRPEQKEMVPSYVLSNFREDQQELEAAINQSIVILEELLEQDSIIE